MTLHLHGFVILASNGDRERLYGQGPDGPTDAMDLVNPYISLPAARVAAERMAAETSIKRMTIRPPQPGDQNYLIFQQPASARGSGELQGRLLGRCVNGNHREFDGLEDICTNGLTGLPRDEAYTLAREVARQSGGDYATVLALDARNAK